uniref:Uncharacterized protein n=1 Tax=Zea mays TaxID=4577 RepID=C0PMY2_MAIZE|nr:unknown [Zea mays]
MIFSSPFSFKISSWHNQSIAQLKAQKHTPKKHNTRRYQRSVLPAGDTMTRKTLWCRLPPPWTSSGTGPCCGGTRHFASLLWMLLSRTGEFIFNSQLAAHCWTGSHHVSHG